MLMSHVIRIVLSSKCISLPDFDVAIVVETVSGYRKRVGKYAVFLPSIAQRCDVFRMGPPPGVVVIISRPPSLRSLLKVQRGLSQ